jgi:RNA polymerase sigma factor (sigma-70 family)
MSSGTGCIQAHSVAGPFARIFPWRSGLSSGTREGEAPDFRALSLESTEALLLRLEAGDSRCADVLVSRFLLPLRRWAHGRLPSHARDLLDTDDLVQDTLLRTLKHLKGFVPRNDGSFLAYLRKTLLNQIKDQVRRAGRRPRTEALKDVFPEENPSPLEASIGKQDLARYDAAMLKLSSVQQEAVMLRLELGFTYEEIARALGAPSANAARMTVARALLRLVEVLKVTDGNIPR